VAVGLLFDPNDYKDDITAAVARATGRELTLAGDLELDVFPSIRIAVGAAELSNAPGFGDQPFARIGGAQLALAVLPLLSGNVAIEEARLSNLELNLARDAAGRNNWQDLSGGQSADAAPGGSDTAAPTNIDLGVRAIEVTDARVTWSDAAAGSRWELTNFNLEAADFGPNTRFPLSMSFALAGAEVAVDVAAQMQATLTVAENAYRLDELEVDINGRGAAWPGGEGKAELAFESLAANLDEETVQLTGLTLDFLGITMRGSLSGQKLLSDLALSGAVDIQEFDPREVLDVFGVQLETVHFEAARPARHAARAR
jgi:AsmA protein